MALIKEEQVRSANRGDYDQIANLILNDVYVHRHLDWRSPLEWIGHPPYYLITQDNQVEAVLACPPDPPGIAWVRIFGVHTGFDVQQAWDVLWKMVLTHLDGKGENQVSVITLQDWFRVILEQCGFSSHQNILTLTWEGIMEPPLKSPTMFKIRKMEQEDIPGVALIDCAAFDLLWQNSPAALVKAFSQAAHATVVDINGEIVGYQITTRNPFSGHLARLAVLPKLQRNGIGSALIIDMLHQLTRMGVRTISVNTQSDNFESLALYRKHGFKENGDVFPVYVFDVK
jgi:ribosomal-protein-alanine N-acetyltransferase